MSASSLVKETPRSIGSAATLTFGHSGLQRTGAMFANTWAERGNSLVSDRTGRYLHTLASGCSAGRAAILLGMTCSPAVTEKLSYGNPMQSSQLWSSRNTGGTTSVNAVTTFRMCFVPNVSTEKLWFHPILSLPLHSNPQKRRDANTAMPCRMAALRTSVAFVIDSVQWLSSRDVCAQLQASASRTVVWQHRRLWNALQTAKTL